MIAEEVVASLGLVPKRMPAAARQTMYLAGTDEERAADLNAAFRDPSIDAVWCIRGGYGSGRLLPLLDWEAIRRNPKPLLGFSDITALLNGFYGEGGDRDVPRADLLGEPLRLHARRAEARRLHARGSRRRRRRATRPAEGRLRRPGGPAAPDRPGHGRGRLVGGNISVFSMLVGTPWEPPLAGSILFLEEVGEEPYRSTAG